MRYLILSVVIFSLLGCKENAQIKRLEAQNAQLVSEYQRISTDIDRTQRFMDESAETLNQVYENLETVSKREGIIAQISRDADGTATGSVKNEIMGNIRNSLNGDHNKKCPGGENHTNTTEAPQAYETPKEGLTTRLK